MGLKKPLIDNNTPQSPSAKGTGNWGEIIAAKHLVALGCGIREQQWKGAHFEIDIIAQKGTRIIFVEVKTRKNTDTDPVDSVDKKRQQHMINAADVYLKSLNVPFDYQFDIISITGTPHDYTLEHIPDAFFPQPKTRR